jgi:hypothetical protein
MSDLKRVLDSSLAELHTVQMKRNETLERNRVSEILNVVADHLNQHLEDKLSLAVSRIWGSGLKPANFRTTQGLYPDVATPVVRLYAEVTAEIQDASSGWYRTPPSYAQVLAVYPRLCDSDQLCLLVSSATMSKLRDGIFTYTGGEWRMFDLPTVKNPRELLSAIIDLLVEPQKAPLTSGPNSFWYFFG